MSLLHFSLEQLHREQPRLGFSGAMKRAVFMGLDMYLMGDDFYPFDHPKRTETPPVRSQTVDLGYRRKHPNLHGYIVNTFAEGVDECQEIHLSKEAMEQIIAAIKSRALPETIGFFFGESEDSAEQLSEDVDIFQRAIRWLEEKTDTWRSVSYRASW